MSVRGTFQPTWSQTRHGSLYEAFDVKAVCWSEHDPIPLSSGPCLLNGSNDEFHVSCDDRIYLYPAAPIRLATMLNAWNIDVVGWG